ncbi:hypothetical protein TSUD_220710 [Trifolium subterraneum]|uniref:DUF659 domain-containing protein n=1 Tax=Trifolium subterraneum TaxID=3900 RepID=A0A2Z6NP24_TRISU|nr:hypothetical protein TSUD_220710 [Trifolium subterraneum]
MIDAVVEEVGEDNVIQVVTDNAANCKASDLEKKILVHGDWRDNSKGYDKNVYFQEWRYNKCAKLRDGKAIEDVVLDKTLWKNIVICLRGATPLIKVLRLVDLDKKPATGLIYEAMDQAKEEIRKNLNGVKKRLCNYKPIWNIIDDRWDKMLHRLLHAADDDDPDEQAKIEVQIHDFKKHLRNLLRHIGGI